MTEFFRFPSTPHLAWLGSGPVPREDKLLSPTDAQSLLAGNVAVEEKLDGANIGLSLAEDGRLRVQNRGQYLKPPFVGQFARLPAWLSQHEERLLETLDKEVILFGEWCTARHSIGYDRLPDWLLLFDVYDRKKARFWSSARRNKLAALAGLSTLPTLLRGIIDLATLEQLLEERSSSYRPGPMEGLIIRHESANWCDRRAKLVRSDFIQAIGEHWSRRPIEWNRMDWSNR